MDDVKVVKTFYVEASQTENSEFNEDELAKALWKADAHFAIYGSPIPLLVSNIIDQVNPNLSEEERVMFSSALLNSKTINKINKMLISEAKELFANEPEVKLWYEEISEIVKEKA